MAENDRAEPYIQITRYRNADLEPSGDADFLMQIGGYDDGKGGRYLAKGFLFGRAELELIGVQVANLLAGKTDDGQPNASYDGKESGS